MTTQEIREVARALGHFAAEHRLRILSAIAACPGIDVASLADAVGDANSTVSRNLAILGGAGLVEYESRGHRRCYRVRHQQVRESVSRLLAAVGAGE